MAEPDRLAILIRSARRTYTTPGFAVAERLSATWARRAGGPYLTAIEGVRRAMGQDGAYLLNHSYEWGCTAAAVPGAGGATLLRTLDWPFDGLGEALIVTRWDGGAGPYCSVTWPGTVGVLTGMAPGRFAGSINQPPLPAPRWGRAAGWPIARARVWRSRAVSPTHLLRRVFDRCETYADAVRMVHDTPLCSPAIFTLAGPGDGEAIVIERTRDAAFVPATSVAANHWASAGAPPGRARNPSSYERYGAISALAAPDWSLAWAAPPIVQPDTRVVMMAHPRSGRMLVQGWEDAGPVTQVLVIP